MRMIVAEFEAKPESKVTLEARLKDMVAASRLEPGTLAYAITRDDKGWVVVEAYRDAEATETHLGSAALQAFLAQLPTLVRSEPRMRILDAVAGFGFGDSKDLN